MIIRPDTQYVSPLRLQRGTKLADIPNDPPPKLADIDSAFHIAEYLALLVRHDPHDVHALVAVPEGSKGVTENDKNLWIYEHLRRIPVDLTVLVTSLLGLCTAETCPQMKANEWQYLCTAHGNEGTEECSAIDYILHTLDSTTALLTFAEVFPSRITISPTSTSHFQPLFRRLSRIFSHAYYSHRELFQLAEVETSLYARFVALCEKYELVTPNLLVIPRSVVAESLDGVTPEEDDEDEEEDEDDEEEDRSRSRDKGEGGRRPHSLDRHARPHKLEDLRQGTVKGWAQDGEKEVDIPKVTASTETESLPPTATQPEESSKDSRDNKEQERQKALKAAFDEANTPVSQTASQTTPESTSSIEPSQAHENADPISSSTTQTYSLKPRTKKDKPSSKIPLPPHGTGTLGRGKKGRGTMLWSSDSPSTSTEGEATTPTVETEENPLERTDSIETAILAPEDLEGEGPVVPAAITPDLEEGDNEKEEVVGKDEIELMEEEGVLAPLPPSSPIHTSSLDSTTKPDSDPTKEDQEAGKLEKVDEIEKGIENLEEIKDEEKVIQPAVVDLLGSTPVLDDTSSPSESKSNSETKSDTTEPTVESASALKEESSTSPVKVVRSDEADTISTTDKASPLEQTTKDSSKEKKSTTKKGSSKKD